MLDCVAALDADVPDQERVRIVTRIVVVDDNDLTQSLLRDAFADRGWESVPCTEGRAAFALVKKVQPDLVILDLWLDAPRSGWRVLEELKKDPATRAIPVVVCSWDRERLEENEERLSEGVAAFLVKPFDIDDVYRCVDYALSSRGTDSADQHGNPAATQTPQ